jgi:hypothetical protein
MQIKEGDKVVILRGLREGSVLVFRVDSFDVLLQKAGIADDERTAMAAEHKPTRSGCSRPLGAWLLACAIKEPATGTRRGCPRWQEMIFVVPWQDR